MKRISDKIRSSGYVLALLLPLLALTVVVMIVSVNDFYTSYRGIELLPIRDPGPAATEFELLMRQLRIIATAAMPQLVTTIGMYIIISMWPDNWKTMQPIERNSLIFFILVVLMAISVDVFTGYAYYIDQPYSQILPFVSSEFYADSFARQNVMVALINSLVIDTISSEVFLTICVGLIVELTPDFKRAIANWKHRMRKADRDSREERRSERHSTPPRRPDRPTGPPIRSAPIMTDDRIIFNDE